MSPKLLKYLSILLIVTFVNSQQTTKNEDDVPSKTDDSSLDDFITTSRGLNTIEETSTNRLVPNESSSTSKVSSTTSKVSSTTSEVSSTTSKVSSTTSKVDNESSTTKNPPTTPSVNSNNGIDFSGNKSSITFELNKFRPVNCAPSICLHRCLSIMDPPIKAFCTGRKTCTCEGDDEKMDIKIQEDA